MVSCISLCWSKRKGFKIARWVGCRWSRKEVKKQVSLVHGVVNCVENRKENIYNVTQW